MSVPCKFERSILNHDRTYRERRHGPTFEYAPKNDH
jgi:hypothetical protein